MDRTGTAASFPKPFSFLTLPFEIRQLIYTFTLSTTLSITDHRLSRSPSVEEIAFLASRRGSWNLCITCRLIYSETLALRWENLTISLSRDGTRSVGDDGRHRLGNADQAFRRRVRNLEISDDACYGMCYGMRMLSGLKTLTVKSERVDGLLLDGKLMADGLMRDCFEKRSWGSRGRTLTIEIEVVEAPVFEVGMFTSSTTTSPEVQKQWRQEAVTKGQRARYLWLSDTIPHLPAGCQVILQARVTKATLEVLRDLEGFQTSSRGRARWNLMYEEEV